MRAPWHALHDHLVQSTDTLAFHKRFLQLRRPSDPLQPFSDPPALLDHLHTAGGDPVERNAILRSLTIAAQRAGTDHRTPR